MPQQNVNMQLPESKVAGVLADFVGVGHNPNYFTLDFAAVSHAEQVDAATINVFAQVVSRVKILPEQVFEIMKALEQQLSQWEVETGRRSPGADPRDDPKDHGSS